MFYFFSLSALPEDNFKAEWTFNATLIEACSCPMFCQCYFSNQPAAHHTVHGGHGEMEHFCKFNIAALVNKGSFNNVDLTGVKFWQSGDTGPDFSQTMFWNTVTFDPSVSKEQKEGILKILEHIWSLEWKEFNVADDAPIEWKNEGEKAVALLDKGKLGEVKLKKLKGMSGLPVVIQNLDYWGVPRHDGFILMPSEIEAYRGGDKPFVYKNSNGFMITIDMNSGDL